MLRRKPRLENHSRIFAQAQRHIRNGFRRRSDRTRAATLPPCASKAIRAPNSVASSCLSTGSPEVAPYASNAATGIRTKVCAAFQSKSKIGILSPTISTRKSKKHTPDHIPVFNSVQRSRQHQTFGTRKQAEHRYRSIDVQACGEAHYHEHGSQFRAGRNQRDSQSKWHVLVRSESSRPTPIAVLLTLMTGNPQALASALAKFAAHKVKRVDASDECCSQWMRLR
jgi:hypothetical protein